KTTPLNNLLFMSLQVVFQKFKSLQYRNSAGNRMFKISSPQHFLVKLPEQQSHIPAYLEVFASYFLKIRLLRHFTKHRRRPKLFLIIAQGPAEHKRTDSGIYTAFCNFRSRCLNLFSQISQGAFFRFFKMINNLSRAPCPLGTLMKLSVGQITCKIEHTLKQI